VGCAARIQIAVTPALSTLLTNLHSLSVDQTRVQLQQLPHKRPHARADADVATGPCRHCCYRNSTTRADFAVCTAKLNLSILTDPFYLKSRQHKKNINKTRTRFPRLDVICHLICYCRHGNIRILLTNHTEEHQRQPCYTLRDDSSSRDGGESDATGVGT
jgi:hypothetical protein